MSRLIRASAQLGVSDEILTRLVMELKHYGKDLFLLRLNVPEVLGELWALRYARARYSLRLTRTQRKH